jgi:hypothetical protein
MGMPVRIDDTLYEDARAHAQAERRTIARQIEFWAIIGRTALDNPDLPIDFVRDLLVARAEGPTLATPFVAKEAAPHDSGHAGTSKRDVQAGLQTPLASSKSRC